jgi:glycosyltransferase involved in cell wall biosynthesis
MCRSLSSVYSVSLVVADGNGDEQKEGVNIYDVGAVNGGRLKRMTKTVKLIFLKAKLLDSDLYHLHDPELIPIGLKLKRAGKSVIFDSHEDIPKQILGKYYFSKPVLWVISKAFSVYEQYACKRFDGVIAATPPIRDKFKCFCRNTVDINNFPRLEELVNEIPWDKKKGEVCYVGTIASNRGIREITTAMGIVRSNTRLNLCGAFRRPGLEDSVKSDSGWQNVNYYGYVNRVGVREVLERSVAGLVILHPLVNYIDSLPVKMFEYMSAGLPVIASDFPLWREIITENNCGLLVDPLEPSEIAKAIDTIAMQLAEAQCMGSNGRKAVTDKYNWNIEEKKLFEFYDNVIEQNENRI